MPQDEPLRNAVNELIAHEENRAMVGFILCTGRDEAVAPPDAPGHLDANRYTVGKRGVLMAGDEAQVTEGIEEEMAGLRRVEQQVAEFAARRARDLADGSADTTP